jgi:pimeloyl-ACP methyl ester carboxylesterase
VLTSGPPRPPGPGPARWLAGTGPMTVVLESGLGASGVGWARVAAELTAVARVLRYDRRGLGAGPPTAHRDRALGTLVDELLGVVDAAGVPGPVVLVGHSWGASIVRLAALRRPELVAGLVLVEPVPDRWLLRWGTPLRLVGTLVYRALQAAASTGLLRVLVRSGTVQRWFAGRRGALPARVRAELLDEVCRPAHHVAGRREFVDMSTGSRAELAALEEFRPAGCPVLVISGGAPGWPGARLTAAHAQLARAYGADHVVLGSAGHLLPREQPVRIAGLVARVCRQAGERRPGGTVQATPGWPA